MDAASFLAWKENLFTKLQQVSGRSDNKVIDWLLEVECDDVTHEKLANSGKFSTLDIKLINALTEIAKGELGRMIIAATQKERRVKKQMLKGRQALLIIYEYFAVNSKLKQVCKLNDLMKVKLVGGDKGLVSFLTSWDHPLPGHHQGG